MVHQHFLKKLNKNIIIDKEYTFRTMSGEDRVKGVTYLLMKILDIEKNMRFFIIDKENFKYDFLLGLDCIKQYRLCQDHELNITQNKEKLPIQNENTVTKEREVNWNEFIPVEEFEVKTEHLDTKKKKKKIFDLINKYDTIFARNKYDVGTVKDYEAHIKLSEKRYVAKKPYRCSYWDQQETERQVAELLQHGMIEESCSPFASPVTLAYKKENGEKKKNRMCIDFRDLNKLLISETHPFLLIDDIIVRTRNCKWFTSLDINSAFWSILIRNKDRYKLGFVTQQGHWQWKCLPFGLKNAPPYISTYIVRNNKEEWSKWILLKLY